MRRLVLGVVGALLLLAAPARAAFDPDYEAKNFSKTTERSTRDLADAGFQADLVSFGLLNESDMLAFRTADPERDPLASLCAHKLTACAGDVRLYDWDKKGYGMVKPVVFTARNGAELSGHVWMTKAGPAQRPGVVITNGSVQAPEELYWYAAQTLAKHGYVVLTFDPQGQGYSDTLGEGADASEGVPAQSGRPFFDNTEDALDFFLSTPDAPFRPRPSCTSGTSHDPKQQRRVKSGLNAGYNPFWKSINPDQIGLAGHSFGAQGVSYVGQIDSRVKAIVAWDNLSVAAPASDCKDDPSTRSGPPKVTKPGLGFSADYGLLPEPNTSEPDPQAKNAASHAYSAAGVDTMQINIRGGTHYEFSYIPNPAFGATLRGIDLVAWYTGAWFDRELKRDPTADARLLTTRWHDDAAEKAVDPFGDGNLFSGYLRSRYDLHQSGGKQLVCEDMRTGCADMTANDGRAANYSYVADASTPDTPAADGASAPITSGSTPQNSRNATPVKAICVSKRSVTITVKAPKRERIVRSEVYVAGKRVAKRGAGNRVPVSLKGLTKGTVTVIIKAKTNKGHNVRVTRRYKTCSPR